MNKKIMKDQADRNFKNITKIHLDIQNERLNQEIRDRLTSWARIGVKTSELRQWDNLFDLLLDKKSEGVKEEERKDLLLAGKCPECGRQKYGFSLDENHRIFTQIERYAMGFVKGDEVSDTQIAPEYQVIMDLLEYLKKNA